MESSKLDTTNKKRSWSEVNKARKEERKKWKEESLEKKHDKVHENKAETEESIAQEASVDQVEQPKPKESLSTLSIAVPGSILENAQSPELRTYLAGQIARAACIFQVDEIIVFDDYGDEANAKKSTFEDAIETRTARQSCIQLGRILQYLECPQYLRKSFFPIHKDLKFCGVLNPLNAPHHLGPKDDFLYREGVVLNTPVKPGKGSVVNVGLLQTVRVDKLLIDGIRCTVKMLPQEASRKKLKGIVVSPSTPREDIGVYWGYSVRIANSLSQVFLQCPYDKGYDITLGTSDRGSSVDEFECPSFKHMLVMFGGVQGLEFALENDDVLKVDDPKLLFDYYLNTLPDQGCRTIRTEEAMLISLAALRPKLCFERKSNKKFDDVGSGEYVKSSVVDIKSNHKNKTIVDDLSRFD